jgi:hypothetical protein
MRLRAESAKPPPKKQRLSQLSAADFGANNNV